jgi:hypothetical protein
MPEVPQTPNTREQLVDSWLGNVAGSLQQRSVAEFSTLPLAPDGVPREFFICGPASTVLGRLAQYHTGIPLQAGGDNEHFELDIRYYCPPTQPEDEGLISDHTFIQYHTGAGKIYYLDAVYPLLWGGANFTFDRLQELITYKPYPAEQFDAGLAANYHLYPFTEETPPGIWQHPMVLEGVSSLSVAREFKLAINSSRPEDNPCSWLKYALDIIREVEPDWNPDANRILGTGPRSYSQPHLEKLTIPSVLPGHSALERFMERTRERYAKILGSRAASNSVHESKLG